jgi:hypothetical protein
MIVADENIVFWLGLGRRPGTALLFEQRVRLRWPWRGTTCRGYNLSGTGQLIPFIVGVLSLLQIMHLILVQISKRASQKRERDIM